MMVVYWGSLRYRRFDPDDIGRSLRGIKPQCQQGTKIPPQSLDSGFVEFVRL